MTPPPHLSLFPAILTMLTSVSGFLDFYGHGTHNLSILTSLTSDDALYLTPYIEKGQIEKGQSLSVVPPMLKNIESFSGYLTVNKDYDSNLFFWMFKSQHGDWTKRPTVLWLQGGPGVSSLFGLFTELGPFSVNAKQELKRRKYSWNREYNLLFFDQPVGTGFSFTKNDRGFARDETAVARDLYEALVQLHKLFPSLQKNKFIISGESYAGKYIPAIGYKIHQENPKATIKIDLSGLMIGNGFTSPGDMMHYSSYLYQLGLVDEQLRAKLQNIEEDIRTHIKADRYNDAADLLNMEFDVILKKTRLRNPYDFTENTMFDDWSIVKFVEGEKTRKALHVGNNEFNGYTKPYVFLWNDLMRSVKPWVEELLAAEVFPIMFFSGQLDVIVAYPLSLAFFESLQWPRAFEYRKAERCYFMVGNDVAGYFKTAGTFTEVLVRNAGHMVPTAQPKWAFELLDRFVSNSSSFTC
nr:PREDICTED: venom serine carboxypeptidase-like [Bemisia tabaci]